MLSLLWEHLVTVTINEVILLRLQPLIRVIRLFSIHLSLLEALIFLLLHHSFFIVARPVLNSLLEVVVDPRWAI